MVRDNSDKEPIATPATSATPRKVRGLLDLFEADKNGESWIMDDPSPDYIPGMGLGATKQATRWAWIGYQHETVRAIQRSQKRPAHRPRKEAYQTVDAARAYNAWVVCRNLRLKSGAPDAKFTARYLIEVVQACENSLGVSMHEQLFNRDGKTNEQSVSRGKKALEIDSDWNSAVCEELEAAFAQTT